MEKKKNNKKKYLALLLALFVCAGGTMAWLTSTSQLTNTFTVGQFTPIDKENQGPTNDENWEENKGKEYKLKGNLYEPHWEPNPTIAPGSTVTKDPYVGIGPGSENAYVYVMVKNEMRNVYFTINNEWQPVEANYGDGPERGTYTQGLFKYTPDLKGDASHNSWSTALFTEVKVSQNATYKDLTGKEQQDEQAKETKNIYVQSFIHQKDSGDGTSLDKIATQKAIETYNSWNPTNGE